MRFIPWSISTLSILAISSLVNHKLYSYTEYSGSQMPGQPINPSEYHLPGRPYDDYENQMPGKPIDPTDWGLPGRGELPGQNTSFSPEYDSRLSLRIQDALSEGRSYGARFSNVYPVVHKGFVTLRGYVATEADKNDAQTRAQRVSGIQGLNNQIMVQH